MICVRGNPDRGPRPHGESTGRTENLGTGVVVLVPPAANIPLGSRSASGGVTHSVASAGICRGQPLCLAEGRGVVRIEHAVISGCK